MDAATAGSHNPYPVIPTGFLIGSYLAVSCAMSGRALKLIAVWPVRYPPDPAVHVFHDILCRPITDESAGVMDLPLELAADGNHRGVGVEVLCGRHRAATGVGRVFLAA